MLRIRSIEIWFTATARLELRQHRIGPVPASGPVRLTFVMTRPADFEVAVFDLQGRRVFRSAWTRGPADLNQVVLSKNDLPRPGVYFYMLSARFGGERDRVRGRIVRQ